MGGRVGRGVRRLASAAAAAPAPPPAAAAARGGRGERGGDGGRGDEGGELGDGAAAPGPGAVPRPAGGRVAARVAALAAGHARVPACLEIRAAASGGREGGPTFRSCVRGWGGVRCGARCDACRGQIAYL